MILLDTDVLSALMAARPDPRVVAWLDRRPAISVWTSAVAVYEIRFGIDRLPPGTRRDALDAAFGAFLAEDIEGRVVPLDGAAAGSAGAVAARLSAAGRSIGIRDATVAGIALARRATLATRNVRRFDGTGVPVDDPWADGR